MAALLGLLITISGGYGLGWRWTGFSSNGSLWDWLHLMLLPIVLGGLPLWIRTRHTDRGVWRLGLLLGVAGLAVLVIGGYGLAWTWTGFGGNRLWDWLHLLVLPIVVGLSPLWFSRRQRAALGGRGRTLAGVAIAIFALLVLGGYRWGWTWTGFAGNKLWDWIELLLVPALVPIVFSWLSVQLGERQRADEAAAQSAQPEQGQEVEGDPGARLPAGSTQADIAVTPG